MSLTSVRQVVAVVLMSLLSVPKRLGAAAVVVIGTAGVVAVIICVLAMATGFTQAAVLTGHSDRAMVLSRAVASEAASGIRRRDVTTILDAPGIKLDPEGNPVASAERLTFIRLTDRRTGLDAFAVLRGVGTEVFALRPEIKIIAGRTFTRSLHEIIVGRSAQSRLAGVEVGNHVVINGSDWEVVGAFESNGDSHESELLTDAQTELSAFHENIFNSVTVALQTPGAFAELQAALTTNPSLSVDVERETDYFINASRPTGRLLTFIALTIGVIMALGAVIAALNTMYSAVSVRSMEIATLRALGFDGGPVVISVLIEAQLLALTGAVAGAAIAWMFFNGNSVSAWPPTSASPITFALHISPGLIAIGVCCAWAIGMLGGLIPSIRASRLSVVSVMRGS